MLPRQSSECKRYFREARTKSGFGGNYRRCLKLKIAFLLLLCIIIVILIIFIIIFIHRFFLFSGSGSKLKSHFAFNWYSLTPQKRPNEFDVKTFGPTSPPLPSPFNTLPAPKNFDVQTVVLPGSSHYLSPSPFPSPSCITGVTSTRWSKDNVNERMTRCAKKAGREKQRMRWEVRE